MELLDRGTTMEGWKVDDSESRNSCIMIVEFYGNDNSLYEKVHKFENNLRKKAKILDSGYDKKSVDSAWSKRKIH
jgi:hypothetical protein